MSINYVSSFKFEYIFFENYPRLSLNLLKFPTVQETTLQPNPLSNHIIIKSVNIVYINNG